VLLCNNKWQELQELLDPFMLLVCAVMAAANDDSIKSSCCFWRGQLSLASLQCKEQQGFTTYKNDSTPAEAANAGVRR
jgi:hypothetical protein